MNKSTHAVIRWAGSKAKILSNLKIALPPAYKCYHEPFFGSGSLYFSLQPEQAVVSDINPELIAFYNELTESPKSVFWGAVNIGRTKDKYYEIRERYSATEDARKRASMFLYLNRFCFNGIYRTNKSGIYNVPFGQKTGSFPKLKEFERVANQLRRAKIVCADFEAVADRAQKGDLVYLDPPYAYAKHKDRGEYGPNSFRLPDMERLEGTLSRLDKQGVHFLLSYVDCPEVDKIRHRFNVETVPVKRCIASLSSRRVVVNELLIRNY